MHTHHHTLCVCPNRVYFEATSGHAQALGLSTSTLRGGLARGLVEEWGQQRCGQCEELPTHSGEMNLAALALMHPSAFAQS
eukprot:282354-Pelagomonas_calceolata.AAC.6